MTYQPMHYDIWIKPIFVKDNGIEYPDITTKAKAQEFIGLPVEKLKAEKKEFKEKVLPEWDKKAAERQATY